MWQALRTELHPFGLEIVTVSLELSSPEASRPFIEAAHPEHPSLLDPTHQLDAKFGVVNIPNVIWIDEDGMIVRPAEPGWPGPTAMPDSFKQRIAEAARASAEAASPATENQAPRRPNIVKLLAGGQDREAYPDAIRDWVRNGASSEYAMSPADVVAASTPRQLGESEGAAHFELANHYWRSGNRAEAIFHFNECHRLQPDNWTYKRQAWSLVGSERVSGPMGAFAQNPLPGEEAEWPFTSSFDADVSKLEPGEYYPKTI